MLWYDKLLLFTSIAIDLVGPVVLLLLLQRWTRRWWVAIVGTVVITPFAAFFLTGGMAWLATYLRVVIRGDTSVPDMLGQTVPEYLSMSFVMCGAYGVMFAGTGFGLSLPLVGLWRLALASNRKRFKQSSCPDAAPDRGD